MRLSGKLAGWLAGLMLFVTSSHAQIPENIRAELKELGDIMDPVTMALLYRPLHASPPYQGVKVSRDLAYGPDSRNVLDIFEPESGQGPRTVLLFVAGGSGDKIENVPNGDAFYDNVMLWATRHGMTGVSIQRRGEIRGPKNGEDVGMAIRWVRRNIARYGGEPERIFVWGQSAGAMSLADYLSRSDLHGPNEPDISGAILMSGPYNLAPAEVKFEGPGMLLRMGRGATPVGPPPDATPDPATALQTSNLPGLKATKVPLFIAAAERDPPMLLNGALVLNEELRKAGKMPAFTIYKQHNHSSEMYSVNTTDTSVTDPILAWMKTVK
jgi:acetyl esterase/lipase